MNQPAVIASSPDRRARHGGRHRRTAGGRGRRHPHHRSGRDRGQLARARSPRHAGGMRRGGEGRRLWPAALEPVGKRLARAGCRTFFVADLAEARRLRAVAARSGDLRPQRRVADHRGGLRRHQCAPGHRQHGRARRMGRVLRRQGWHGGAALHVDTGMNRLGISADDAAALAPRIRAENHGITLADEPSRLRRRARASAQSEADRAVPRGAAFVSRHPRPRLRQFVRHLPRQYGAIATWSARARRCYGVNPTPRQAEPDAGRGRTQGACPAGAHGPQKRDRRLWRRVDGTARRAHRHRRRRLWRRLSALRERHRRSAGRGCRWSPASAVRSPAASRWT